MASMTDLLLSLHDAERLTFLHDERLPDTISVRYEHWGEGNDIRRKEIAVKKREAMTSLDLLVTKTQQLIADCRERFK